MISYVFDDWIEYFFSFIFWTFNQSSDFKTIFFSVFVIYINKKNGLKIKTLVRNSKKKYVKIVKITALISCV